MLPIKKKKKKRRRRRSECGSWETQKQQAEVCMVTPGLCPQSDLPAQLFQEVDTRDGAR